MSYLDLPRVIFDGDFQADVSTVNNDVRNFDIDTFDPGSADRAWNPTGSAAFRLLNCRVRDAPGEREEAGAKEDPVLTAVIAGSVDRVSAKIVDLDPQWQLSSALWGLRVELRADENLILAGDFEPASFRDIWFPPVFGTQRPRPTARFQSVLHNIVWARPGVSRIADRLREASTGGKLSIRLMTFAFNGNVSSPRFTIGSVVGAIGPYRPDEPHTFVTGRRFAPIVDQNGTNSAGVNYFDGVVRSGKQLVVDLANALPILDDKGTVVDQGELRFGVLPDSATDQGATVVEGVGFTALGDPLPYRDPGWLLDTGGIATIAIPPRVDIAARPLALLRANAADHTVVVRETLDGWLVRADKHIHRAESGDTLKTRVHVARFGRPAPRAEVTPLLLGPAKVGPLPPTGTPATAFTAERPERTDADGQTTLRVRCSDPGTPRGYIDGQIYQMVLGIRGVDVDRLRHNPLEPITALVFDDYEIPAGPTWLDDVQPIFKQYANLYPIMSERLIRLDDYEAVREHRAILQFAFSRDIGDPNAMPVTRDLSRAKRRMILNWLALPDLPVGTGRPRPVSKPDTRVAEAVEDDTVDPTDSKGQFARAYLRSAGAIERTEP
ncbi:hypothetical protein JOF56_006996 [Kibdelosporangium banguiense]|uniref:Phage tail protein n=1 Tax=Kibdelosporangium banguiense TaxID=1365924 RepID=A0ABS4TQC6_9PSEU|nr:hypothetical protein [Kibdelosporangium banguiense]MBP2326611.1 hypothetical protein [Kibdelosporangium banguiense]